jgi:hypothetical protein
LSEQVACLNVHFRGGLTLAGDLERANIRWRHCPVEREATAEFIDDRVHQFAGHAVPDGVDANDIDRVVTQARGNSMRTDPSHCAMMSSEIY